MRLRVESDPRNTVINDYRIQDGGVEMRSLDPSGREYPKSGTAWRPMSHSEIQVHYVLGTAVSEWLEVRLGNSALDRAA